MVKKLKLAVSRELVGLVREFMVGGRERYRETGPEAIVELAFAFEGFLVRSVARKDTSC